MRITVFRPWHVSLVAMLVCQAVGLAAQPSDAPAKLTASGGALLQHSPGSSPPWKAVKLGSPLPGDTLLIAVPEADIDSANGAVRLRMIADLARRLPEPVYESAVLLHKPTNKDIDLEVTLDRGLIILLNQKDKGPAAVRLHAGGHVWDLLLEQPDTRVALALIGRHAAGLRPYIQDPSKPFKPDDHPTLDLYLLVLKGEIELTTAGKCLAMNAPPGPAAFHWSNIDGDDSSPRKLDELPDFAKPPTPDELKLAAQILARAKTLNFLPIDKVLDEARKSSEARSRMAAVTLMGATDDLDGLFAALNDPAHPEVRDHAAVIFRHWLGRKAGQDEILYKYLTEKQRLTPAQAGGFIQLLHGFSEAERETPELYSTLISYLKHDKLPVRELVRFHLYRLVPAGKDIPFDAAGSPESRAAAIKKWKELIPDGSLPPKPKVSEPAKP